MAYVPLTTQLSGGTILAAWGNQVKDNFAAGVPDIFTTKGDLAAATGSDAAVRVGVGTNYQLLESLSTATPGIAWGNGVYSLCTKAGAQSINSATMTKITVGTVVHDPYSMLDAVNNRITIPVGFPSRYCALVAWGWFTGHATVSKFRHLEIQVNGTAYSRQSTVQDDSSEQGNLCCFSIRQMIAGDYIEAFVKQNSGGALNFNDTYLGLFMIR